MLRRQTIGLATLLCVGCLAETDDFARVSAQLTCKRLQACDVESFETLYDGDRSACRDDLENNNRFAFDALLAMGCTYEPSRARACIKVARKQRTVCSAEADAQIADACEAVIDCTSSGFMDPET